MWCHMLALSKQGRQNGAGVAVVASGAVWCPSAVVAASPGNILCPLFQEADTRQPKRPLCQSGTLPGTLLHADRVDSAAGCTFTDIQSRRDWTLAKVS